MQESRTGRKEGKKERGKRGEREGELYSHIHSAVKKMATVGGGGGGVGFYVVLACFNLVPFHFSCWLPVRNLTLN